MATTLITMEQKKEIKTFQEQVDEYKEEEQIKYQKEIRQKYINSLKEKGDNITYEEKNKLDLYTEINKNQVKDEELIRENYYKIMDVIDYYLDIKPEYQNIIALWIIGTYFYQQFETFPELFIHAMRGSGKSRALRLITTLSDKGHMLNSITDAVLFRTQGTLAIDEFEGIGSKEKQTLRELLNSAYKKGSKVYRMREKKSIEGKKQVIENFDCFRPIVMANIWGMDEVLSDRCITIILEKSSDQSKIMLVEDYENDENILNIKNKFFWCSLCSVVMEKKYYMHWNNYVKSIYTNYTNTLTTLNYTNYTSQENKLKLIKLDSFFNKIRDSGVTGRNLELFMPLFMISRLIGDDVLEYTIKTSSQMVFEKKQDEETESLDVMLYDFVSKNYNESLEHISIKEITNNFKSFSNNYDDTINDRWIGRALKRLCLINSKRRVSHGMEVILNISKAKEKMKIFRTGDIK